MAENSTITRVNVQSGNIPWQVTAKTRQHSWLIDEPSDLGGSDRAPTPDETLLAALGACTTITLQMYASRKKWILTDVQVTLELERLENGNLIHRHIQLEGALDEKQKDRLLAIANACPVHKLLTQKLEIDTKIAS